MVEVTGVLQQLRRLNVKPHFWSSGEIKELANVMVPGEVITAAVFGWYDNGLALLCCTNQRVLLIDKKLFFFKMEDLRYDKIAEIKFLNHLFDSMVILTYPNQTLEFRSLNQSGLRKLMAYVQSSVMSSNHQHPETVQGIQPAQPATMPVRETPDVAATVVPIQQVPAVQDNLWPALQPAAAGMSYEMPAYPEDLMRRATSDLHLPKNPYAPTNKFLRRRLPILGLTHQG